jgi:para-nitrobenzyl esterase
VRHLQSESLRQSSKALMQRIAIALATMLVMWANASVASDQQVPRLGDVVQVDNGSLRGNAPDAAGVRSFLGIPYAAPPVGPLRWQSPQAASAWEGERDATRAGNRCWSNVAELGLGGRVAETPQSEDCLYLNVWSGAPTQSERRPVMVWLHGGGFQFGTGRDPRTDGARLAGKGVVVVSLNYRIGAYGFFAHPLLRTDGRLSGNFGLQDQIAALQWVRANIAHFGGDPNNVTIFGESAGSQSASIFMGSPLAKGLFHKAIGQSGSSLQQLPSIAEIGMRGAAFAGALGAGNIEALRALPAERINAAAARDLAGGAPMVFAPGVDGYLIPANMADAFQHGRQNDVPLLAGYNKREDYAFPNETLPHKTCAEFRAAAQWVFGATRMPQFQLLYPCDTDASAKPAAESLFGDIRQRAETWRWLSLQSQSGQSKVYGYILSYESPYSPVASHGADVPFVFGNLVPQFFAPRAPAAGAADRALSDAMMSYWVNFATTGNPNGPGLAAWPEFRSRHTMLQIREDGQITSSPPSVQQLAKFRFLNGFLISASMGQP